MILVLAGSRRRMFSEMIKIVCPYSEYKWCHEVQVIILLRFDIFGKDHLCNSIPWLSLVVGRSRGRANVYLGNEAAY